jgi:hypothetical protein
MHSDHLEVPCVTFVQWLRHVLTCPQSALVSCRGVSSTQERGGAAPEGGGGRDPGDHPADHRLRHLPAPAPGPLCAFIINICRLINTQMAVTSALVHEACLWLQRMPTGFCQPSLPCGAGSFDLLVYADTESDVPSTWCGQRPAAV